MTSDIGPMRPDEHDAVRALVKWAFISSDADLVPWFERIGAERFRVVRAHGQPVACWAVQEMGQWFGGRVLRAAGIAAVAVDPAARGKGHAVELCRAAMHQAHADGYALATLYPTAPRLYRKVGFENAGLRCRIDLPLGTIGPQPPSPLVVRPVTDADEPAIQSLYDATARTTNGYLHRNAFHWWRAKEPTPGTRRLVVTDADRIVGYCALGARRYDGHHGELLLGDLLIATPDAGRKILALLADHRSICERASWHGTPTDPLLALLDANTAKIEITWRWMLRVVNVERALEERGYPAGVRAEVELEVEDALLAGNSGRYRLRVADGVGTVERRSGSGSGGLRMGERGLAALFAGYMTPEALRAAGMIEGGSEEEMRTAAAVFGGPIACMADFF